MQTLYFEHPTEETLERFVMHKCGDEELEVVETHILACEACVSKLEALEVNIAAAKIALAAFPKNEKAAAASRSAWKQWFTIPRLSWAGAAAVLVLGVAAYVPADVNVAAYRGTETIAVPEWRPLHIHVNTTDLTDEPLSAELVDGQNAVLWSGSTSLRGGHADLHVPRIRKSGDYFLRIYTRDTENSSRELLNEFALKTR